MNLAEFKAWFEGFTEGIDKQPTQKQWARICEKVKAIKDAPPVPQQVFVRDYWRPWYTYPLNAAGTITTANTGLQALQAGRETYSSTAAFNMLGKAEALSK